MRSNIYNGVEDAKGDTATSAKSYGQLQSAYNSGEAMVKNILKGISKLGFGSSSS